MATKSSTEALTAEALRQCLSYDQETGAFIWRETGKGRNLDLIAGTITDQGYRKIMVDQRLYRASRLAWLYMTGEWPKHFVDHINMSRNDDRWSNLREVTNGQNMANQGKPKHNTSGLKGVSWDSGRRKWAARLGVNNRSFNLGRFDCPAAAHLAYVVASDEHFKTFARTR